MVSSLKLVFEPFKRGIRCFKRGSQSCHSSAGQWCGQGGWRDGEEVFSSGKFFFVFCVGICILQEGISGCGSLALAPPWHEQLFKRGIQSGAGGREDLRRKNETGCWAGLGIPLLPLCHSLAYPPTLL